ncbi:hypothetical protein W02_33120 [Nitrospira sp. KM1]|nr:hypothetical protein W02_33120 [Nitrospira sp. KM1]
MYWTVLVEFPRTRYELYSAQARKGLELLDTENVPQQGPVCGNDPAGCRKDQRLSTVPDPA